MRVAVSMSVRQNSTRAFDVLSDAYVPFLSSLGLIPILIPNYHPDPVAYAEAVGAEGLVLTGGGDIDPQVYGQVNDGSIEISTQRDAVEFQLMTLAVERRWPVLGICRGFQVVNVYFGGSLVQDIPSQVQNAVPHEDSTHPVTITDARLHSVVGGPVLTVNTYHHQAVLPDTLASGLDVFAVSEVDGVIEGIRHRAYPVLAVQWHPERRDYPSAAADVALLRGVFDRAWW